MQAYIVLALIKVVATLFYCNKRNEIESVCSVVLFVLYVHIYEELSDNRVLTVAASSTEHISTFAYQTGWIVRSAGSLNCALVTTIAACCIAQVTATFTSTKVLYSLQLPSHL